MHIIRTLNYVTALILSLIIIKPQLFFAQNSNLKTYQYISPVDGSTMIHPENTIIIRYGEIIDLQTVQQKIIIEVSGSLSGQHGGEIILSADFKTLIFKPDQAFTLNEKVTVNLLEGITTVEGNTLPPIEFSFKTSEKLTGEDDDISTWGADYSYMNNCELNYLNKYKAGTEISCNSLNNDFPSLQIKKYYNPSEGYFFLAPYTLSETSGHLIIVDNSGIPIFYKKTPNRNTDFNLQPNGLLTFTNWNSEYFFIMDSSYSVIDSTKAGNGYIADKHEFLITANGNALFMIYDKQSVRMDTIVQGGDSSAAVIGLIVQELDVDKNVIFQWRSWDHFKITDATEDIDLTQHTIDYVHGNSIEVDYDGNLLISSRHLDEITKINRNTGKIIWRLGGKKSRNNEFQFYNDPITFSHQHDIRLLNNGNYTIFDNGNLHDQKISRGIEYKLDEFNKTATLIWNYLSDNSSYSSAMGSLQRLPNQNSIIGWGYFNSDSLALTEVSSEGNVEFEAALKYPLINYRVFKYPWRTNYLLTNPDSIIFEEVYPGDSVETTVQILCNSSKDIYITDLLFSDSTFTSDKETPFTIMAGNSEPVKIKFNPTEDGDFEGKLYIQSNMDSIIITQILTLSGAALDRQGGENTFESFYLEQNYPNPFNPSTTIEFGLAKDDFTVIKLYDILGNEVETLISENKKTGDYKFQFDASSLPSGVYFYKIHAGNYVKTKKMVLIK